MKFLFKLIPLYAVLSIVGLVLLLSDVLEFGNFVSAAMAITFVIVGLVSTISSYTSVFEHLYELGKLQKAIADLTNTEEYLREMKDHVKMITDKADKLDDNVLAKSNVDHPIVSALHILKQAQGDVGCAKNNINDYESRIAARKNGPFGWVVDMYGEKLL